MATFPVYHLYIELEDYKPTMWRRFAVTSETSLARLAYIIMTLYEARNNYSYQFQLDELQAFKKRHPEYDKNPEQLNNINRKFRKKNYGVTIKKNVFLYTQNKEYGELIDSKKVKISEVLSSRGDEIKFFYDPNSKWTFNITLEKIDNNKKLYATDFPKVTGGDGYGIIESCGDTKSLKKFRDDLKQKGWVNNTNYRFYSTIGDTKNFLFDRFRVDDMDFRIKKLPRVLQDKYENNNTYFSDKIIKVMNRKYRIPKKK